MVNEVLVRMREDEIDTVSDKDNDPQQKLVCKFVQDAHEFVKGSHTWNAQRRVWTVPLLKGKANYTLPSSGQSAAIYTARYAGTSELLRDANARFLSEKKYTEGKPGLYATSMTDKNDLSIVLYPVPDERYTAGSDAKVSEYGIAEYNIAEYSGTGGGDAPSQEIAFFGYSQGPRLVDDSDDVAIPDMPVMYYALAYASRERGELGGQSTGELFALAASYMSDAISWDVNNSNLEYIWSAV